MKKPEPLRLRTEINLDTKSSELTIGYLIGDKYVQQRTINRTPGTDITCTTNPIESALLKKWEE